MPVCRWANDKAVAVYKGIGYLNPVLLVIVTYRQKAAERFYRAAVYIADSDSPANRPLLRYQAVGCDAVAV